MKSSNCDFLTYYFKDSNKYGSTLALPLWFLHSNPGKVNERLVKSNKNKRLNKFPSYVLERKLQVLLGFDASAGSSTIMRD